MHAAPIFAIAYAASLGEALGDKHRLDGPGRSERMQVEVPKPKRTWLEADELAAFDRDPGRRRNEKGGKRRKPASLLTFRMSEVGVTSQAGTRFELVTPSLPCTVARRRRSGKESEICRASELASVPDLDCVAPTDYAQYAAIVVAYRHSVNPSGE